MENKNPKQMKMLYKKTEVSELLRVYNITGVDIEVSIATFCF